MWHTQGSAGRFCQEEESFFHARLFGALQISTSHLVSVLSFPNHTRGSRLSEARKQSERDSNRGQTGLHSLCTKDSGLSAGSYESHHGECLGSSVPAPYVAGVSKGSTLYLASAHQAAISGVLIKVRPGRLRPRKLGIPLAQQQVYCLGGNI